MITTIMAAFAFGYTIMDIVQNIRAERRLNKMIAELQHDS